MPEPLLRQDTATIAIFDVCIGKRQALRNKRVNKRIEFEADRIGYNIFFDFLTFTTVAI